MPNNAPRKHKRPGEFALIARFFAPLSAGASGAFGLADDAALIAPKKGQELVVTADSLIEGVHFRRDDPPGSISRKALRVNLSDLAAKGAKPAAYLLSLSLPSWPDTAWVAGFAKGLARDQREFGVSLVGGDTTATPGPLAIAITAIGFVPKGTMIRRSGARVGDAVFVSGTIGDAGAGLALLAGGAGVLSAAARRRMIARYRLPMPRISLGCALRGVASAALDVSDGLLADLGHIAEASGVRLEVEATRLPISSASRVLFGSGAIVRAASAGDDYELAFTAPARARDRIARAARRARVPVAEIGRIVPGRGVALLDAVGREIAVSRRGYTHF